MIAAIPNNALGILPTAAPAGRRAGAATPTDPFADELVKLHNDLATLAIACAEATGKTAQHYYGEDSWVIGTMPGYGPLADAIEATARGYLANSHLLPGQAETVANTLKMSGDMRTAARGARQAVQLAFLLKQDPECGQDALNLLCPMADAVVAISDNTANAIRLDDPEAANQAAQLFRRIDGLRIKIEAGVCSGKWDDRFTPPVRKMIRAAVWNFAISGEGMARVSARLLMPSA